MSFAADEAKEKPQAKPAEQASKKTLCPFCAAALSNKSAYHEKAGNTLVRGAINFGFGWTEMITQPAREAENGGNMFNGMANGISRGIGRTFGGLGEMLTFWTPKVEGEYIHFLPDCPLDSQ